MLQLLFFFRSFYNDCSGNKRRSLAGLCRARDEMPNDRNSLIVERPAGNGAVAGLKGRRKLEACYLLFFSKYLQLL